MGPFLGALTIVVGLFVSWKAIAPSHSTKTLPLATRLGVGAALGTTHPTEVKTGDRGIVRLLAALVRRVSPEHRIERIDQLIQQAGRPIGWTVDRMLAMKVGVSATFSFLGLVILSAKPGAMGFMMLVVGGFGGFMIPEMLLTGRARARQESIQEALADAIDQLTVTVRAGLSIDAAILRVSHTLVGPLGEELRRVVQDMQIGVSRSDALKAFAERIDLAELNIFVRALVQADTLGVPVSTTLMAQADDLRVRRRQRSEEMAMKLPIKILAPTVLCILPALLLVVLGPAVIQLMRNLTI